MSSFVAVADCDCGCKLFIIDTERVPLSSLKKYGARREAKKMNRLLVDTGVSKACPKCKREIDLTNPDEKWIHRNDELIRIE
jgi:hypothetical protein